MSSSTAELTLIVKAQNLAETELAKVRASLGKITVTARTVAQDVANAFKDVGRRIGRQLGNLATDILSGGSITNNLVMLGATMAGAIVEGLSAHFIPMLLGKLAATGVWIQVSAAFAAGGVTAATAFDAAVAITMAALPFVILAAAVAALVFLATHPEARQKAREVALMIIGEIGKGLQVLGKLLYDRFQAGFTMAGIAVREAMNKMLGEIRAIVTKIVDTVLAIPRAVAKALESLAALPKDFKLPNLVYPSDTPHFAEGGMVPGSGPQLAVVHGGEQVLTPAQQRQDRARSTSSGFTIQGVSERDIVDMVDRGLYFKLRRAAPTAGRA